MTGIELLIAAGILAGKEAVKNSVTSLYDASTAKAKKALRA
jgi:Flp pilus assembly pilin Flp